MPPPIAERGDDEVDEYAAGAEISPPGAAARHHGSVSYSRRHSPVVTMARRRISCLAMI